MLLSTRFTIEIQKKDFEMSEEWTVTEQIALDEAIPANPKVTHVCKLKRCRCQKNVHTNNNNLGRRRGCERPLGFHRMPRAWQVTARLRRALQEHTPTPAASTAPDTTPAADMAAAAHDN